ncbi:MAG: adenylate/guanylate cyclase domain-containing protein [bacterium]|nr:adenylate/guanylate cyclase domain-containing protein [bacterium]
MKIFLTFLITVLVFLFSACSSQYSGKKPPKAEEGRLDLGGWDFKRDGPIKLNGKWEFYWGKHLSPDEISEGKQKPNRTGYIAVPGSWNGFKTGDSTLSGEGFATYRLMVSLKESGKTAGSITEVLAETLTETLKKTIKRKDSEESGKAKRAGVLIQSKRFKESKESKKTKEMSKSTYSRSSMESSFYVESTISSGSKGSTESKKTEVKKRKHKFLALKLLDMATAYTVYVNGAVIASNGKVSPGRKGAEPEYWPHVIDFESPGDMLDIVIHVSNFHHRAGGIWETIKLGHETHIRGLRERRIAQELFLFGSLLIMSLYHISLFVFKRNDRSPLFFGIFCFLISFRSLLTGERYFLHFFPGINWELFSKFEYISFYLAVLFFAVFIYSLFKQDFHKIVLRAMLVLASLFSLSVIVTRAGYYSYGMQAYQIITLLISAYIIYTLFRAYLKKREGAGIFLQGFFIFFIAIINDILYQNQVINTGNFVPYGLFAFIFFQACIIAFRFSSAFFAVEDLSRDLQSTNDAYERFVPKQFLGYLGHKSILDVRLGDNVQKEMTILFADIRSFTTFSETMTPEENFKFLNAYLGRVGPIVSTMHGFIDKYIGDSIMALFPNSGEDAVRASIQMIQKLKEYNTQRVSRDQVPVEIGVGVHTGTLMLGTIGEKNRMDSTVIADAVNLASRIEGLTKVFGAKIIISEETLQQLEDPALYNYRYLGNIQVKGKTNYVVIYEIFDADSQETIEKKNRTKEIFESGIQLYFDQNFDDANNKFNQVLAVNADDSAAQYYLLHIRHYLEHGTPPNWHGAEIMKSK